MGLDVKIRRRMVHFVGANGIPYRVYAPLLRNLESRGFEVRGDDLYDDIKGKSEWGPMVMAGHFLTAHELVWQPAQRNLF